MHIVLSVCMLRERAAGGGTDRDDRMLSAARRGCLFGNPLPNLPDFACSVLMPDSPVEAVRAGFCFCIDAFAFVSSAKRKSPPAGLGGDFCMFGIRAERAVYCHSRQARRWRLQRGVRSFFRALASIWRMRSRVTRKCRPTSSRVFWQPSSRPNRIISTSRSRVVR